ncbi:MAG: hypothetical protein RSG96_07195 [Clostridia bacterium]
MLIASLPCRRFGLDTFKVCQPNGNVKRMAGKTGHAVEHYKLADFAIAVEERQ